jgi:methionyl-tRNA formyltransferase
MTDQSSFVIACHSAWFWDQWSRRPEPDGVWHHVREPEQLSMERLEEWSPRFVFLPHWSERVPDLIWQTYECVVFHAAPLPYGRGGSPIQNMVLSGHEETEVVALRVERELDAGPVYLRRRLSLLGGGDEVFMRVFATVAEMVREVVETEPAPAPQEGEVHVFKRRGPQQSRVPASTDLDEVFDHIRILDADGYPLAFLDYGPLRIELSRATRRRESIEVDATIRLRTIEDAD